LFGPPGIIFFDSAGKEIHAARVIGFQKPQNFLTQLRTVQQDSTLSK